MQGGKTLDFQVFWVDRLVCYLFTPPREMNGKQTKMA
jgi:hypothetical protein